MTAPWTYNAGVARRFIAEHDAARGATPAWAQVLNVVGEAGEFAEAYRRATGNARRTGTYDDVGEELADVIISAYVCAERIGLDLDQFIADKAAVVFTRGFGGAP